MDFVPLIAMATLVGKLVDFLQDLYAKNWKEAITFLIASVVGVGVAFLVAATSWATDIPVGESKSLAELTSVDLVFAGLVANSLFAVVHDRIPTKKKK